MQTSDIDLARRVVCHRFTQAVKEHGTSDWSGDQIRGLHDQLLFDFANLTTVPLSDPLEGTAKLELQRLTTANPPRGSLDAVSLSTLRDALKQYTLVKTEIRDLLDLVGGNR